MTIRPIFASVFLISILLLLAVGAEAKTINIRDFGAVGNGITDDAPAINRAIEEGVKLGPGTTVIVPKGRYHLESRGGGGHVNINNAVGFTVRGEPGAIFAAQNPDINVVSLSHCTSTKVQQLTLEQERTYFTQGTITSISPDGKSCDVTIDGRYDEPDAPSLAKLTTLRSFSYSDTTTYRQDRWWPKVKTRTRTGDHTWHLEIEGWALTQDMAQKPFIIWDDKHGCHGINFDACSDCLVEDVNYYGRGTNAGLFLYNCSGAITLRRYNIKPLPGSDALLSCSGGGQMIDCRGSLIFEDCWFDKVDDDGSDILTGYDRVLKQIDARTLQIEGHRHIQPGDHVAIVDWQTRMDRQKASIVSAKPNPDGSSTLVIDQDAKILRTGTGNDKDNTSRSADGIDRITDYNLACSSVTFRKCRIQALRARGLNLKAQNCLIEDCLFYDCSMP
ncbi:MAG: glycoside hydrolase family 55 protein, partial [Armatimonadota bacterium]|nr:glycoside hydrolase family 55 protein [Armatimonadota bacterium]